jgi:threonine synthase
VIAGEPVEAAKPRAEGVMSALERLDERIHRIAIIEDNVDAARLLRRILQARGNYTIDEANNGTSGLELVKAKQPDLILLDLMMPEMDGFQVLDYLRADEATRHIPVIIVTAKELTREDMDRLDGQIDGLLQKGSFMDDDLLAEMTESLAS